MQREGLVTFVPTQLKYTSLTPKQSYEVSQSDTMYGYTHHMSLLKDDYNW